MLTDMHADKIKELSATLKSLTMKDRDEVELFIRNFKALVFDYKMIGLLYDYYTEDICVIRENRETLDGIDALIKDTTELLGAFPDMTVNMESIIINGSEKEGYKAFCRTRYQGTNLGHSPYGPPTGKSLGNGCMGLSMFNMKKIDGQWKIYDEMNMISMELIVNTLKS